jgi:dTDP-4-amino-4,6-dideoxygalactose transaminase
LTNDDALAGRMARLRSHGITRDPAQMERQPDGPWYYEQLDLGLNYRMTELHAALGLSQLTRLHDYVQRRHHLARRYDTLLKDMPLVTPWQHPDCHSAMHLYVIRVDGARRRRVFDALRVQGIGVNVHYIPVHLQPYYRRLGFAPGSFPEAERHYAEAISLPMYASLTEAQQDRVVDALRQALRS